MPGLILLVWIVAENPRVCRYAIVAAWVVLVCVGVAQTWSRQTRAAALLELPGGRVALRPQTFEKLNWLAQRTTPDELFFQAAWTSFYLPLRLRNPVFVDALESSGITSPENVALTIQQLEMKRVQYVLWPPRLNVPDPYYGEKQYHLGPFHDYLHEHYHRVWSFSDNDEMWERNSAPSPQ
jgi:hypothetical protein